MTNTAERISELETRLEFQDETIAQLNDALIAQQKRLDDLEKRLQQLVAHIKTMQAKDEPKLEPPPPHY
ncbi:MAG: SlyX family protein [Gammaproteobacteria bacterium TMED92]|nr:MAG: SlyX family protein [Gammaproteobacteria bacterium TMED92]